MNKDEFNNLEILEQIEYVNRLLLNGESLRNISNALNMSKSTIRERFKKIGYFFNADKRQYIQEYDQGIIKVLPVKNKAIDESVDKRSPEEELERMFGSSKVVDGKSDKSNTKVIPSDKSSTKVLQEFNNMKSDLLELIENKNELIEMLKYYKNNINVIEVPQLDINNLPEELQDKIANKSIKVYEGVYNLFDGLCKEYSSIKKQDLISLALYEFYKKYNK